MGFIGRIINTLIRPGEAMENISKEPLIEEAVMIVGIYALFSAAAVYMQSKKVIIITEGISQINPELVSTISIVSAIVLAFITWFILAGIIHTISLALGGKGNFYPHMMVLVGFAMLPLIFSNIISMALISTAEATTVKISLADPSVAQQMFREIQNSMPYFAISIMTAITWIWCIGIIYYGLWIYQKLSKRRALITVAIPLVLMLFMNYGLR